MVAFAVAAAACGLFPDLSDLGGDGAATDATSNDGPVASDSGAAPDASTDASDASTDAANDGSTVDAGCPLGPGPTMLEIDSKTCIDSTEVTVAEYRAFFQAVDAGNFGQPGVCAFNTSFTPANGMPSSSKNANPIAYLNWCQAYAFCAWAGKSLCGTPDGGAVPWGLFGSSAQSTWMRACSANGAQTYPYGATYDAGACNLDALDGASGAVAPVATYPGCVGSLPGLYDMVGNIKEWENSCSGTAGAGDNCQRRGSGFDDNNDPTASCSWNEVDTRDHQSYTTGVRCCAYLP